MEGLTFDYNQIDDPNNHALNGSNSQMNFSRNFLKETTHDSKLGPHHQSMQMRNEFMRFEIKMKEQINSLTEELNQKNLEISRLKESMRQFLSD